MASASKPVVRTVRAVHPNAGVDAWYQTALIELAQSAHLDLTLSLSLAWKETPPITPFDRVNPDRMPPALALDAPSPTRNIEAVLKAWGTKWRARFDRMSVTIANGFARRSFQMTESAMRDSLKQGGFTVKFRPTRGSKEAFRAVLAENVGLIRSIQQQYLTGVQTHVWESVRKGADMATLSRKLQDEYGSTVKRSALIARDQNAKAKATIENTRRAELGITRAIWQHSGGGKEPRPSHVKMSGEIFDLARGMWDPDEKEWILPGQLINCRCTSRAIIPGLK